MIALSQPARKSLQQAILKRGVADVRVELECDEQTMMRAAIGVPLRDDVAKRIASAVNEWEDG